MTGKPAASRAASVSDQPLESAKAPWTRAIVGVLVIWTPCGGSPGRATRWTQRRWARPRGASARRLKRRLVDGWWTGFPRAVHAEPMTGAEDPPLLGRE